MLGVEILVYDVIGMLKHFNLNDFLFVGYNCLTFLDLYTYVGQLH